MPITDLIAGLCKDLPGAADVRVTDSGTVVVRCADGSDFYVTVAR